MDRRRKVIALLAFSHDEAMILATKAKKADVSGTVLQFAGLSKTRLPSNIRQSARERVTLRRRQIWRSHHYVSHSRKPRKRHAAHQLHGTIFRRTGVTADRRNNSAE